MQRKFLYDYFESGKCFLVEYIGGSEPQLIQREIIHEQYTAIRDISLREDLTEAQRGALIAAVLDPTPAEKEKVGA